MTLICEAYPEFMSFNSSELTLLTNCVAFMHQSSFFWFCVLRKNCELSLSGDAGNENQQNRFMISPYFYY